MKCCISFLMNQSILVFVEAYYIYKIQGANLSKLIVKQLGRFAFVTDLKF